MSKSISSIDVAVPPAGISRGSVNRQPDQHGGSVFAKLLATGGADVQPPATAAAATTGGNRLPEQQSKTAVDENAQESASGADNAGPETAAPVAILPEPDTQGGAAGKEIPSPPVTGVDPVALTLADGAAQPLVASGVSAVGGWSEAALQAAGHEPAARLVNQAVNTSPAHAQVPAQAATAQTVPVADLQGQPAVVASATSALPEAVAGIQQEVPVKQPVDAAPVDRVAQAVHSGVMKMLLAQELHNGSQHPGAGERFVAPAAAPGTSPIQASGADSLFAQALTGVGETLPAAHVPVTVGQPGWGRAVGEQMIWFVSQNIRSASLRLNPQHLGPMEMQVQMDGDKASIAFTSQHAQVRDALESALPRLREMFAANGLDLVNVNVSQHNGSSRGNAHLGMFQPAASNTPGPDAATDEILPGAMAPVVVSVRGLVDYYV